MTTGNGNENDTDSDTDSDTDNDRDVIVVGGGPVGVVTALLLARRGLAVTVLERATEIYDLPRAIVMDDEIQRVFHGIGLGDGLDAITTPMPGAEFVTAAGDQIIGIELPVDADWPLGLHPVVCYYQPELEHFLRRAAIEAGVDIRLGVGVTGCRADAHGVDVHVEGASGTGAVLRAPWVVAADGASSAVRKALGIDFVDQGFDQDWLVLDVRLRRPVASLPRMTRQICDPARPVTFVPGHDDYRRWEFQVQPGESREELCRDHTVWGLLSPWLGPDDAELVRAVVYRFHATVAAGMRAGRIFLAGDAAHQMPPFLGQGLCSGIRDAANLAWKLDLVHRGVVDDSLLDTYGAERLPHAAGVVAHAVDTGRLIDQLAGRVDSGTGIDAAYGGQRPFPHLHGPGFVGDHLLVGRQLPRPDVDGRPLDVLLGDGYAVLVRDRAVAEGLDDRLAGLGTVVVVDDGALGDVLDGTAAVVVRPDRYVAAVVTDPAGVSSALDQVLPARVG